MGSRLRAARLRAGFRRQKDFRALFGLSHGGYAEQETGQRRISIEQAVEYAKVLGCSLEWLITGRDPQRSLVPAEAPDDVKDAITVLMGHCLKPSKDTIRVSVIEAELLTEAVDIFGRLHAGVKDGQVEVLQRLLARLETVEEVDARLEASSI